MHVDFRAAVTFAGLLRACLSVKHTRTHNKLSESLNLKYELHKHNSQFTCTQYS